MDAKLLLEPVVPQGNNEFSKTKDVDTERYTLK